MSEIKPALTEKEWADAKQVAWAERWVDADDPHLIAALALHDQPFGFTWADVDALRESMVDARCFVEDRAFGSERQDAQRQIERAESAIDRIAALLPPRES